MGLMIIAMGLLMRDAMERQQQIRLQVLQSLGLLRQAYARRVLLMLVVLALKIPTVAANASMAITPEPAALQTVTARAEGALVQQLLALVTLHLLHPHLSRIHQRLQVQSRLHL